MVLVTITAFVSKKMELVGIQNVSENDLICIKFLRFFFLLVFFALSLNLLVTMTFFLGKRIQTKNAESRYQQAFEPFSDHTYLKFAAKIRGGREIQVLFKRIIRRFIKIKTL